MAVKVSVNYQRTIAVPRGLQETFTYISQLETSLLDNFPGLERFEKVQDSIYRWEFEKVSHSGYDFTIRLNTRITGEPPNYLKLESVPGSETSTIDGGWKFSESQGKTEITFEARLGLELPLPFFLKAVAGPLAQNELSKLFDRYLANVEKALA